MPSGVRVPMLATFLAERDGAERATTLRSTNCQNHVWWGPESTTGAGSPATRAAAGAAPAPSASAATADVIKLRLTP